MGTANPDWVTQPAITSTATRIITHIFSFRQVSFVSDTFRRSFILKRPFCAPLGLSQISNLSLLWDCPHFPNHDASDKNTENTDNNEKGRERINIPIQRHTEESQKNE